MAHILFNKIHSDFYAQADNLSRLMINRSLKYGKYFHVRIIRFMASSRDLFMATKNLRLEHCLLSAQNTLDYKRQIKQEPEPVNQKENPDGSEYSD